MGARTLKEADMDVHDGRDWLWMTVTMGFWLVALGIVIFVAVRLAERDRGSRS